MSEENKIGYYAVIPSTILFNNDLKPNEKLLYAVITVLSNKEGYCYASNAYLGKLFNVIPHTISIWVSNLKNKGFLYVDIITDEKGEVIQRRIYPNDTPYVINKTGGTFQKGQYNIISNNKIDRFFNYIINNKEEFPAEFSKVDFLPLDPSNSCCKVPNLPSVFNEFCSVIFAEISIRDFCIFEIPDQNGG